MIGFISATATSDQTDSDALGQVETHRSRSEQLAMESAEMAALATERAAQELTEARETLANAQANARWPYRRRLRRHT